MWPRIQKVEHLEAYKLHLTFTNEEQGEVDLRDRIVGRDGVFAPLEEIDFFRKVMVDSDVGTLVWPNGVDLDPDVLYSLAMNVPLPEPQTAIRTDLIQK